MNNMEYIRRKYNVPAKRGGFVRVRGALGHITSCRGQYIWIKLFNEIAPKKYHPQDPDIEYED